MLFGNQIDVKTIGKLRFGLLQRQLLEEMEIDCVAASEIAWKFEKFRRIPARILKR